MDALDPGIPPDAIGAARCGNTGCDAGISDGGATGEGGGHWEGPSFAKDAQGDDLGNLPSATANYGLTGVLISDGVDKAAFPEIESRDNEAEYDEFIAAGNGRAATSVHFSQYDNSKYLLDKHNFPRASPINQVDATLAGEDKGTGDTNLEKAFASLLGSNVQGRRDLTEHNLLSIELPAMVNGRIASPSSEPSISHDVAGESRLTVFNEVALVDSQYNKMHTNKIPLVALAVLTGGFLFKACSFFFKRRKRSVNDMKRGLLLSRLDPTEGMHSADESFFNSYNRKQDINSDHLAGESREYAERFNDILNDIKSEDAVWVFNE